jgi:hypothetical protein
MFRFGLLIFTDWQVYKPFKRYEGTYEREEFLHWVPVLHVVLIQLLLSHFLLISKLLLVRSGWTSPFWQGVRERDHLLALGSLRLEFWHACLALCAATCALAFSHRRRFHTAGRFTVGCDAGLALGLEGIRLGLTLLLVLVALGLGTFFGKFNDSCLRAGIARVWRVCLTLVIGCLDDSCLGLRRLVGHKRV